MDIYKQLEKFIVPVGLCIVTLCSFTLFRYLFRSAVICYFNTRTVEAAAKHFIPNWIKVEDHKGNPVKRGKRDAEGKALIEDQLDANGELSFKALIKFIKTRNKRQKILLLVAPTGVGKTTYLHNIYLALAKDWRWRLTHSVLLGSFQDSSTREMIKSLPSGNGKDPLDLIKGFFQKASKMVLLVDAMDEFNPNATTSTQYWTAFNDHLKNFSADADKFGTVILCVREQFLIDFDINLEKNGPLTNLGNYTIAGNPIWRLKLGYFRDDQIDAYVKKRFPTQRQGHIAQVISSLRIIRDEQEHPLIAIPLILQYIDLITPEALNKARSNRTKSNNAQDKPHCYKYFDIYSVIVSNWFEREPTIARNEIGLISDFYEELAQLIARNHNHQYRLQEEDFRVLEALYFQENNRNEIITHFGDRSLLIRTGPDKKASISFAHSVFMDYFLGLAAKRVADEYRACYAADADIPGKLQDKIAAIDLLLAGRPDAQHGNLGFAQRMQLEWGWWDVRNDLRLRPKARPSLRNDHVKMGRYLTPADTMQEGLKIVESISPLPAIRSFIKSDIRAVLESIDAACWEVFRVKSSYAGDPSAFPFANLIITNNNLHQEFLEYFYPFVQVLYLSNLHLDDDLIHCLSKVHNVEDFGLGHCTFGRGKLYKLCSNFSSLKHLLMAGMNLADDDVQFFDGISSLSSLTLTDNDLSFRGLMYFRNSLPNMMNLALSRNKRLREDEERVFQLIPANRWKRFEISGLSGTEVIQKFLCNSQTTLKDLTLNNAGLVDDDLMLLTGFQQLEELSLMANELTGSGLRHISHLRGTLRSLYLSNNDKLAYNSLAPLLDFENITHLALVKCPPQNPALLAALAEKFSIKIVQN